MTNAIFGITGMPGSRKSDIARIISRYGFPTFNMSDVVREEILRVGLEPAPDNYHTIGTSLRKRFGPEVLAERVIAKVVDSPKAVIIDGIRTTEEVGYFTNHSRLFRLLCVYAPRSVRYERMRQRSGKELQEEEDLVRQDEQDLALGIGDVITFADYMVVNDGMSDNKIEHQVSNYISQFLKEIDIGVVPQGDSLGER